MSNPFVVGPSTSETATQSLPTFTEFAWDFAKDDFIYRRDGSHEIVTGKEAIKVWVLHVLRCERYRYLAYFDDYGIELEKFIGTGPNDGQRSSELFRYVGRAHGQPIHYGCYGIAGHPGTQENYNGDSPGNCLW